MVSEQEINAVADAALAREPGLRQAVADWMTNEAMKEHPDVVFRAHQVTPGMIYNYLATRRAWASARR